MSHACKRLMRKIRSVKADADKLRQELRGRKEHFQLGPLWSHQGNFVVGGGVHFSWDVQKCRMWSHMKKTEYLGRQA